jgi:dCTP deaminase
MIYNDRQLIEWASKGGVTPFDQIQVNPASIDLRLGPTIKIASCDGFGPEIPCPDLLYPGQFILAHTLEFVKIPENAVGTLCLKSSMARQGFDHSLAGFGDPGFWGQWTLELRNIAPWPLQIYHGMRIVQMILTDCDRPDRLYSQTGHYQNQTGTTEAR